MKEKRHPLRRAFVYAIPVITGHLFLGFAFGVFLESEGYGWPWALLMSVFICAGLIQLVTVNLLAGVVLLIGAAIMILMVNARHLFHGIAMLDEFCEIGWKKPYMISLLTDETFTLLYALKGPSEPDRERLLPCITLLNQLYWVPSSTVGSVFGSTWRIPLEGIDFVMTALLTMISLGRWKAKTDHTASILGIATSVLCLLVFGSSGFAIPAMLSITAVFLLLRGRLERREGMQRRSFMVCF